jgi:murein L,D-transpeptidase YcbB/YkuD
MRWRLQTVSRLLVAQALATASAVSPAAEASAWVLDGRPTPQARQAIELLVTADTHGLAPDDYAAGTLDRTARSMDQKADVDADARFEATLTAALRRYLTDLHFGRVEAQQLPPGYVPPRRQPFDAAAVLQAAVQNKALSEAARRAAPAIPQYEQLRVALSQYRALVDHPAWSSRLPALPRVDGKPKLEPGMAYEGVPLLRSRLIALGDLAADAPSFRVYDDALVEAVRSFQRRHGLSVDGIVGQATLRQLNATPAERVRQIELSLERLRWTPLLQGPRMVVVNVPEFVLRAYEVHGNQIDVRQTMKIIVGKALDTRTPLLEEDMQSIEFSPYWNVPWSIARKELVPRLLRDPAYWMREGFEFVTAQGAVVETLSPALLDATVAGTARIRQRPGPRNALGDIKFVFPNRDNIYLHHTPSVGLFERDRRDLSHGCIRVERPVALALFVMAGMPVWTEDRVREAMQAGESRTVRLTQPVPVLIAYGTAIVRGGRVHFFDDIYGHDRTLDAALRRPRPPLLSDR